MHVAAFGLNGKIEPLSEKWKSGLNITTKSSINTIISIKNGILACKILDEKKNLA